jgi:hypothetical protein
MQKQAIPAAAASTIEAHESSGSLDIRRTAKDKYAAPITGDWTASPSDRFQNGDPKRRRPGTTTIRAAEARCQGRTRDCGEGRRIYKSGQITRRATSPEGVFAAK